MNKKTILFVLSLALLSSALIKGASGAPPRLPGVVPGNWMRYENIVFSWNSTDPDAKPPSDFEEMNNTLWLMGLVTEVNGANVSLYTTQHFVNGTDKFEDVWINVDTGESKNMTFVLVAADLNAGDSVYTSPEYSYMIINETISVVYPDGPRDTNHLNLTMQMYIPPPFDMNFSMHADNYWDRATGVLTKMNQYFFNQTGPFVTEWSINLEASSSNIWIIPEFNTAASLLIIFTAVSTAAVVYKRKSLRLR